MWCLGAEFTAAVTGSPQSSARGHRLVSVVHRKLTHRQLWMLPARKRVAIGQGVKEHDRKVGNLPDLTGAKSAMMLGGTECGALARFFANVAYRLQFFGSAQPTILLWSRAVGT
jgi:hypothetical protein